MSQKAEGCPSKTSLRLCLKVVIVHRKLRYYVPEHMVTASAYFYICIFVVPSLGHQQHWTPVGGCNADSSEAILLIYMFSALKFFKGSSF